MTPTRHAKDTDDKEDSKTPEKGERAVRKTVDDYPERPLEEARGDNLVFDPSVPEQRESNIFLEHTVTEPGNPDSSRFNVAEGVAHFGELPHADYVEDPNLHPGYNPPVY